MSNFTRPTLPKKKGRYIRRLSMLLFAPLALLTGAWSFQNGDEKVTIKGNDVPLIAVFKSIKKQTGYSFFYAADYVDDKARVSLDVHGERVENVLQRVLGRDYVWVYNENAVSISKKKLPERRNDVAVVADSSVTRVNVSGAVTDEKGAPIPGATVMVKGTHEGATTDESGRFSLTGVGMGAKLVISSVGFEKREVEVKGRTILMKLGVAMNDLNETVVVAYGTTTQRANVGAITVVKGKEIESLPNRSFDRSLQGQVPGLLVTSGNGQPGGGLSNFLIRGIGTGTDAKDGSTVRNPLIVVDGVPVTQDHLERRLPDGKFAPYSNPMAQFNPSDIETISVLKDAAAIALYGTRAANGVILVTTKKGKAGKTQFSFRHQIDISEMAEGKIKLVNQHEYIDLLYEAYRNVDPVKWTDAAIRSDLIGKYPTLVKTPGDTSFYSPTDWLRTLTNNRALTLSNDLSLSGGSERMNYYLNLSYVSQDGIVKNTEYDRVSVRYNMENKPANWITVGVNSMFSYNKEGYGSGGFSMASTLSPLDPVRLSDGSYNLKVLSSDGDTKTANPVAAQEYNINSITSYRQNGNAFLEIRFLKKFSFRSLFGADFMLSQAKNKVDMRLPFGELDNAASGLVAEQQTTRTNLVTTNTLRYVEDFDGNHLLNILVGQESQEAINKILTATGQGFSVPYLDEVDNGSFRTGEGSRSKESLLSWFSQVNYAYRNKYFISGSLRRDGSSKFGIKERYGNYWSFGGGWIVTDEKFMKGSSPWLSYMKIRASIGTSGNAAAISSISRFYKLAITNYAGNPAVRPDNSPGNESIKWEETFNTDLGLESNLFNDRIKLTADIYKRRTSNLIYAIYPPLLSGYRGAYFDNIGEIENKGIEISFSADIIQNKNFRWNVSFNWSTNGNKLIKAYESFPKYLIGRDWSSMYYVRWAGVNPSDGKPQWLDSLGKITSVYNPVDQVNVGKSQPDGFGGINTLLFYRGIELSAAFYYQYGYKIYDASMASFLVNDGIEPYGKQSILALNRWRKPGDVASNPRRVLGNTDGGTQTSTRYLFNGDHIRLQNILLAYTLPSRIVGRFHLSSCRVYLQGNNLILWNMYSGNDPQNVGVTGLASLTYPQATSFSAGININF
ncbi:SusC/RagA family TonB-linked outer membrane protein [Chitinophaga agrisoli]|uniref:SusC/RagA family TonB-linked outer membrane protein n=1 Tax=Chitinophaga agrisoli TaxID=2607653 RepID=A0A5B2VNE5_9BACT|nr:SusC/RagA family TonB-linked outer membrane protein [Chitinophaga agrisoli]KAA2239737.1 SusC/RagA family TonB-linked outer membrane protein [Chitinophaga agrisoli]